MYCVYGNSGWYINGGPLFGGGPLLGGSVIGGSTVHITLTVSDIGHLITLTIDFGYYAYLMEFFSYSVLLSVTQYEVRTHYQSLDRHQCWSLASCNSLHNPCPVFRARNSQTLQAHILN